MLEDAKFESEFYTFGWLIDWSIGVVSILSCYEIELGNWRIYKYGCCY